MAEQVTQERAKEIVAELATIPTKRRIWEIDALRGLLILLVVFDHIMWDIRSFSNSYTVEWMQQLGQYAVEYYKGTNFLGALRSKMHDGFVMTFLLLSGISCSFSRHNAKRGVKMAIFALAFTAVTCVIALIINIPSMKIIFNVIHVIAICILLWALLEWVYGLIKVNWGRQTFNAVMIVAVALMLVLGYYFKHTPCTEEHKFAMIFVQHTKRSTLSPGDYLPLLPGMAYFLMGAYVGKSIYKDKVSLFPNFNEKIVLPLTFCGRHSLIIYFASQVVMYGALYLLVTAGVL